MASHFEPAESRDGKMVYGWKRVIDITLPLHEGMAKPSPVFEGFRLHWDLRIEKGQGRNRSRFSMESHLGTHVDAPVHFIKDGKFIDQVPVENLFGPAGVIQVPFPGAVTAEFLEKVRPGPEILLFKFGKERLDRKRPYFSPDGVKALIGRGVRVVGTDNFNVDSIQTEWEIHHLILGNGILIVEGLNLEGIADGAYDFICLPLLIKGGEGAPARALLLEK
jgi:arylformamidase